jgi:hypothetical protein
LASEFTGKQWQEHVIAALKNKYAPDPDKVTDFPDRTHGDGGIDALVRSEGIIYQCYMPDNPITASDVNAKVKAKISADLTKFLELDPKYLAGGVRISKWSLVTPDFYDKDLIAYCNQQEAEIRTRTDLAYIDHAKFEISICTARDVDIWGHGMAQKRPDDIYRTTPWSRAVWDHVLWKGETTPFREVAARIAGLCFTACDVEYTNPWRDPHYPLRALVCLKQLAGDGRFTLNPRETALLLTAPLLRFAAQSLAESEAWARLRAAPQGLDAEDWPRHWARQLERKPQLTRKMERLLASASPSDHPDGENVRAWMLHDAVRRRPEAWMYQSAGGLLPDTLRERLTHILGKEPAADPFADLPTLFSFARAGDMDPLEILQRPERFLRHKVISWQMEKIGELRPCLIGVLAAIATRMALDPLLMADVIVDHVGLHDSLTPQMLHEHFGPAQWLDPDLTLTLSCTHPAIDLAACETIGQLNALRAQVLTAIAENGKGLMDKDSLPPFLDSGIGAAPGEDQTPLYLPRPHVHFTLSNDEVRELLMGERLYGDPALALRELYQNALDACRYRQARETYQGNGHWQERITFTQSTDNTGRAFIECRDNGIGMGERELRNCFAKAGRRFVDTDDYMEEAAKWRDRGIHHFPNSQFGVGVFSYFMLAEEIAVTSRRMPREAEATKSLSVTISGSGSLFRLRPLPKPLDEFGTTIRLYLSRTTDNDNEPISVLGTLKEHLRVAEFITEVHVTGKQKKVWQPDVLEGMEGKAHTLIHGDRDCQAWWVEGNGGLLADGVATETYFGWAGVAINLRNGRRPALTVDRKRVLQWDKDWVEAVIRRHGGQALARFPSRDYEWFLQLANDFPIVAQTWFDSLASMETPLVLNWDGSPINPYQFGIFTGDLQIRSLEDRDEAEDLVDNWPRWLLEQRLQALADCHLLPRFRRDDGVIAPYLIKSRQSPIRFEPLDGVLLSRDLNGTSPWLDGRISLTHLLRAAAKLSLPISDVVTRLRRFEPLGLTLPGFAKVDLSALPQPDEIDIKLLSRDQDGRPPWLDKSISSLHLLCAAAKLSLPIVEVAARLKRFEPLGLTLPAINKVDLASLPQPDEIELKVLSRDLDGRAPWLEGPVTIFHLLHAAAELCLPILDVASRLRRFEPLGLTLPAISDAVLSVLPQPDEIDLQLLSKDLDRSPPWLESSISIDHIRMASEELDMPIADIIARLKRYEPLGLVVEEP